MKYHLDSASLNKNKALVIVVTASVVDFVTIVHCYSHRYSPSKKHIFLTSLSRNPSAVRSLTCLTIPFLSG